MVPSFSDVVSLPCPGWCSRWVLYCVRARNSSWVLSSQVVLQRMVLSYRELRSRDPSLELHRVCFALLHANSLFHVQTMLTSLLHRCELNIPGLRCEQMDKTRVTHRETKYHAAWAKCRHAWQDTPTVVAFLEFSEGIVHEISRFETAGWCSQTCSRWKIETYLCSFQVCRHVGGGTSLLASWRPRSRISRWHGESLQKSGIPAMILKAYMQLVFGL